MSDSESHSECMASFDPVLSNMLLKNLFTYFDQRGWVMYVAKRSDGTEFPLAGSEYGTDPLPGVSIVRVLFSLKSIQDAGREYLVEFLDVVSMLLIDHPPEYERV